MSSNIFLCFECGTKNRMPQSRNMTDAKCGKCGAPLLPDEAQPQKPSGASNNSAEKPSWYGNSSPNVARSSKNSAPARPFGFSKIKKMAWIFGLLIFGGYLFLSNENKVQTRNTTPSVLSPRPASPTAAPLPVPVFQSPGTIYNFTGRVGQNPFEIVTSRGSNYFVKLVDANSGADRIGVYVIGGQRLEVEIPAGRYKMRYASGTTWRGLSNLFGPNDMTSYFSSPDIFTFGSGSGYTIELIRQTGGNMQTRSISPGQF